MRHKHYKLIPNLSLVHAFYLQQPKRTHIFRRTFAPNLQSNFQTCNWNLKLLSSRIVIRAFRATSIQKNLVEILMSLTFKGCASNFVPLNMQQQHEKAEESCCREVTIELDISRGMYLLLYKVLPQFHNVLHTDFLKIQTSQTMTKFVVKNIYIHCQTYIII